MIIYIDIDDTLIRTIGSKIIPIPDTVNFIKNCNTNKNEIYLWSRGGAQYCKNIAIKLLLDHKITGYLPKPNLIIDDTELRSGMIYQ